MRTRNQFPNRGLHVVVYVASLSLVLFSLTAHVARGQAAFEVKNGSTPLLTVDTAGKIGIGKANPLYGLDVLVGGDISSGGLYRINGTTVLSNNGFQGIFVGVLAGHNSTGSQSTFLGYSAGKDNTGDYNTFIGREAGRKAVGDENTFVGSRAGFDNTTGLRNTFIGYRAGYENISGEQNTYIGHLAGDNNSTGSGNVFIGYGAGANENDSNRLYIHNNNSSAPLIYGNFFAGTIGINTSSPSYNLHVVGNAGKTSGGTTWAVASDKRLKDIRGNYSYSLDEVNQLNPVYFSYKKDNPLAIPSDEVHVGLIAQEVQDVIPEAVIGQEDDFLSLNSDPIIWAMLNAIKELAAENEDLTQRIHTVENAAEAVAVPTVVHGAFAPLPIALAIFASILVMWSASLHRRKNRIRFQ